MRTYRLASVLIVSETSRVLEYRSFPGKRQKAVPNIRNATNRTRSRPGHLPAHSLPEKQRIQKKAIPTETIRKTEIEQKQSAGNLHRGSRAIFFCLCSIDRIMDQHDDQSFFNADLLRFGEMVAQKHDLGVGVESGFAFINLLHI